MRWGVLSICSLSLLFVGCSGGSSTASGSSDGPKLAVSTKKPTGEIEVQSFQGGYDIDYFKKCADAYMKANPGTKITVAGNPRVWEQLQPRMVGGNPPDLMFPGWGMDHWALAEEGELLQWEDALKSPAADGKTPWGETFDPAMLKLAQLDGKQVTMPYYVMEYGWWYDTAVFAKNGWTAPKTWSEFMALSAKIKAKGMYPLTYQGKYPYYMVYGMLMPWIMSIGGPSVVDACQNMEPGAWKAPEVIQAAKMIQELRDKGYLQEGAVSMTHTEAQQEFLNGKAAMVPCGTWINAEMSKMMKPGTKLQFMLPPVVDGGKGDPTALMVDIEPWMIPAKAKNPELAVDFFKFMTSLENAQGFVREKASLMTVKGANDVELPEGLKAPAEAYKNSKHIWAIRYRQWYKAFETELENAITALITQKDLTAEAFAERLEKAAQAVRDDPSIVKHKV
ncbi:MAG TPA: extracellular solute-binding protein [Fimbriimonas sp.]|nr:extracellular solute-binding protein [Fimbriimonas sp.]